MATRYALLRPRCTESAGEPKYREAYQSFPRRSKPLPDDSGMVVILTLLGLYRGDRGRQGDAAACLPLERQLAGFRFGLGDHAPGDLIACP